MLKIIVDAYKMFFKNIRFMLVISLPLLALSALNIYFNDIMHPVSGLIYVVYAAMLVLPLVSAATDVCIYRRLFNYNIINPFSSLQAYIIYLLAQIAIGLIGTAPIFLFQYLFSLTGLDPLICLSLAILINSFIGFVFIARFNIILPLIIQNKIPSLKEFNNYTKRKYSQWLLVALLIYLPYVILHYLTTACPYTNMIIVTLFMMTFICFNIAYIKANRLNKAPLPIKTEEEQAIVPAPTKQAELVNKPKKATTNKKGAKITKEPTKKPTPKKTTKRPAPKLKPATA